MKPLVGLTGGIASGKSAVAACLASLGATVIDADALARDVVAAGTEALREIVDEFGADVLTPAGTLDRKRLGGIVFADPAARAKLNAITHPRIAALSAARIASAQATTAPYIVYEAALLVEGALHRGMTALVVVTADSATQLSRMRARDGLDSDNAAARISAQLPTADKVAVADFVIVNQGSLEELRARTRDVHRQLLERFARTR